MVNPAWTGDLKLVRTLVEPVVTAAESHLTDRLATSSADRRAARPTRARLERWQASVRAVADRDQLRARTGTAGWRTSTASRQIEALIADHTPADAPLVRVVGALVPDGG